MNKDTFLKTLRKQLKSLKSSELQKNIGYYEEMIADLTENGLTEEEAIQKIGSPDAIAREILENTAPENFRQKDIPGIVLISLSGLAVLASIVSFIRARLFLTPLCLSSAAPTAPPASSSPERSVTAPVCMRWRAC